MDASNTQNPMEAEQMKQLEEMKKQILSKILTREAYERLSRVRIANPEVASKAELALLQLYQTGNIKGAIDDNQLKELLKALTQKKNINISRK